MDLFEEIQDVAIWEKILDKGVDKSIKNTTLRKYCTQTGRQELYDQIASGNYVIRPPKVVAIPKDDGSFREIYVNTERDRLLLALVNQVWNKNYGHLVSPACKSYREGYSTATAVKDASRHITYGYKIDLSKYFDSVPREVINSTLAELSTGSVLDEIIWKYYNDDTVIIAGKKTPRFKSLAQGCALSAFLSNYILRFVDARMSELCDYYCRYSDDMLLLGPNAPNALADLKRMLGTLGLQINPKKLEEVSPEKEFRFLGFGIHGADILISERDFANKKKEIKHVTHCVKSLNVENSVKLRKAVRDVLRIFLNFKHPTHSWIYTKAIAVNNIERIEALDRYCKEHIRAAVTGKWNYTTNVHKVTEEALRNAGYVSLIHMFKLAQIDRDIFEQECLQWRQLMK